jgi:hypothetical protein
MTVWSYSHKQGNRVCIFSPGGRFLAVDDTLQKVTLCNKLGGLGWMGRETDGRIGRAAEDPWTVYGQQ